MDNTLFKNQKLIIYTDGGSRGNPGPSALGAIIGDKKYGEFLGTMTNNQAEYHALLFALKKAKQLLGKTKAKQTEVEVRMDSELIVKQMTAQYKIEDQKLQPLFMEIWNCRLDFKTVSFEHIPREKNKEADRLVNEALDHRSNLLE
ncbi:MAG: ribonuclease HI family protein [Anaplasmataceae bacterium]|nr:ribonuclease HI family protein [Anaplasmataceae bacterium]